MTIFCFRNYYHWGGINFNIHFICLYFNIQIYFDLHLHFNLNASMIGWEAYSIIYWIVVSALALSAANAVYIGYHIN
jgi:hypothetical protein